MKDKVLLIIPCFNEEIRLQLEPFQNSSSDFFYIFANDGSTDNTIDILNKIKDNQRFFVFDSNTNLGKANIIQAAYSHFSSSLDLNSFSWIGYWDADLATPLNEVHKMILANDGRFNSIWGSRIYKLGSHIRRNKLRHYLGRVFATLASVVVGIKSYDSQCGAKLFSPHLARTAFATPFKTRWIFDIEVLLRIGQENVLEHPLENWHDIEGSKVNVKKELPRVLRDLFILWNMKRVNK